MCNARRCLTCHHISCKSTITSSINGNRYGIQIDKDVDWNSSHLIYVITWEARGCGAQYVGETSQSLKGRFRSHSFKIRNNSRRKYKNFLYDHFIKYNHSIENVTITPVEILSKQPGDSKNDMKKRRLSAELNWIKRLQTPYPLGLNDQIYQQGNISSVRSNINVFSLKPDVRRKLRSHGVRRNGLSRRKQRLNRSLDDLLRIAKNNGRHELLHALSSIPVSRLKPILDEADRRSLRHSDWFKLIKLTKPPQRRQGPDPRPLWLLVGTPLVLGPELASRRAEHSHSGGCHYIFLIYCFLSPYMCNNFYGLSTSVGCWSSAFTRRIIYKFLNVCPFDYTAFAVSGKVGIP